MQSTRDPMAPAALRSGRSFSIPSVSSVTHSDGDMEFMVPCCGTYLVLQLDVAQMVEPLNDPILAAAAQQLRAQRYIGYVFEIEELPLPGKPDHKCCIELIGRGLCKKNEDDLVDPTMCIPIFPATEHPLSRKPLRPRPSFPFQDCYHYTFAAPTIRIPNKLYNLENAVTLPSRDLVVDSMYVNEDRGKRLNLEKAKNGVVARPREDSAPTRRSHSATSSVIRELISQGMPVRHTGARESSGATHVSTQSRICGDGGIVTVMSPADPELEPMPPIPSSCPCVQQEAHSLAQPEPGLHSPDAASSEWAGNAAGYEKGATYVDEHRQPDAEVTDTPLCPPEMLPPENPDDTATSIVQFISDQPAVAQSPTSDILMRIFWGNPDEDRDLIPLVNVGLDLLELNEVHDPNEFLQEVEQIVRLIKESRDRSVTTPSEPGSERNAGESWVDLALETASVAGSDQNNGQGGHPKLRKLLDSARSRVFKTGIWAKRARRRCTEILKVVKAVVTCSLSVSIVVILNVD